MSARLRSSDSVNSTNCPIKSLISTRTFASFPVQPRPASVSVSAALEYLNGLAPAAHGDLELSQDIADGYWRVAGIQGVPTQLNLGEPEKAEASMKRADELTEAVLASRPRDRRALLRSAGIAQERMILAQEEHRDADAIAYARKSSHRLDEFLRLGDATDSERIQMSTEYGNMALAHLNMHMYTDAVPYAQRTVEVIRPIASAQYLVAQGLSLLASAQRSQGDWKAHCKPFRKRERFGSRRYIRIPPRACSMSMEYSCARA